MTLGFGGYTWAGGFLVGLFLGGCGDSEPATRNAGPGAGGGAGTAQSGGSGGGSGNGSGGGSAGGAGAGGAAGSGGTLCRPDGPTEEELGASFETMTTTSSILSDVGSVTIGASGVYWTEDTGIYRFATGSTTRETVLESAEVAGIELRGEDLFYFEAAALKRLNVADLAAAPITLQENLSGSVDWDDTHVVFTDRDAETLSSLPLGPPSGGTPTVLAEAVVVQGLDLQGGFAFFTDYNAGAVMRVPVAGGTPETLFEDSFSFPLGLVTDGMNVYWADDDYLMHTSADGATTEQFGMAGPDLFFPGVTARFEALVLIGDRVWFSDEGRSIGWVSTDGAECGLVIKMASGPWIGSFAVGDTHVYFSIANDLLRVPR